MSSYNFSANVQNRFEQGVLQSNICYVGRWGGNGNGSGLHILSLTNPAAPVLLLRITASTAGTVVNGFNDVHTLFLERNFLYEAAHNHGSLSATNAPYLISYSCGSTNVLVNQQSGGGDWRLIAAGVEFAKGTNGFVRLSNNAGPSVVIADAVWFVYAEAQDFPIGPAVPVWWQNFYFGGPAEPTLDGDGDGYTIAQEYVMGTNPTNSESHLQLSGQTGSSNTAGVTFWPLLGNRAYTLLSRTNLSAATWQPVTMNPPASTPEAREFSRFPRRTSCKIASA